MYKIKRHVAVEYRCLTASSYEISEKLLKCNFRSRLNYIIQQAGENLLPAEVVKLRNCSTKNTKLLINVKSMLTVYPDPKSGRVCERNLSYH